MITLESTVDEVDVNTLQTKLNARNSLQASVVYLYINKFKCFHNNILLNTYYIICFLFM